jgi:hypothetical protein
MMGEEKLYNFARFELVGRCTEPKAALGPASGVNKTTPTKELEHLCGLGFRYPDALSDLVRLQRAPFFRKAAETFQSRVHALGKSGPDHWYFILSEQIVLKGELASSDSRHSC